MKRILGCVAAGALLALVVTANALIGICLLAGLCFKLVQGK